MTVTVRGDDPVIGFQRRKSLDEVVDELLAGVPVPVPVDHVCRPSRWQKCTHSVGQRMPLLDRLAELSLPAQEMMPAPDAPSMIRSAGGHSSGVGGRGRAGSPAPWSAQAAELLDEILRGAVAAQRQARQVLELEPPTVARTQVRQVWPRPRPVAVGPLHPVEAHCGHESCGSTGLEVVAVPVDQVAVADAGRHALRTLPGLVSLLADRDHPLGVRITGEREIRSQGRLEERVRGWHRRVLTVLGHAVELVRLPQLPNPDHPWSKPRVRFARGPVCESLLCGHPSCASVRWPSLPGRRLGPVCVSCGHDSCRRIRAGGRRWLPWSCPVCGADSLRRDPVTDTVHCLRPSCVDGDGARPEWPMSLLAEGSADPWGDLEW